jgi:hypothetical protein
LWSFARINLGLSSTEFFALTPKQFGHLSNRHKYQVEHEEFLFGQLTSWVASTGFKSPKDPTTAKDFMPSMFGRDDKPAQVIKLKRRKRSTIAMEARATMAHFMRSTA